MRTIAALCLCIQLSAASPEAYERKADQKRSDQYRKLWRRINDLEKEWGESCAFRGKVLEPMKTGPELFACVVPQPSPANEKANDKQRPPEAKAK